MYCCVKDWKLKLTKDKIKAGDLPFREGIEIAFCDWSMISKAYFQLLSNLNE